MANKGQIERYRRYYKMADNQKNYFKDMEERELREQYEYLQEWSIRHPEKLKRAHRWKNVKRFFKGIAEGFKSRTK